MSKWSRKLIDSLPSTLATRTFLGITLIESIVDITIVAILLKSLQAGVISTVLARDKSSVLPVYLGLFVLAHIFQCMLAYDAIAAKNMIQILGLCLFNTLFFAYSIVQVLELQGLTFGSQIKTTVLVIPVLIGVTEMVYLALLYRIYQEFGWQVFKKIGADRSIKTMYMFYQVFICLLKFDFFFFISFSLQLVLLVLQQSNTERWLTAAASPLSLIILLVGYYGIKRENVAMAWTFLVGICAGAAYFVFKLFRIYQFRTTDYALIFKSLTLFASLSLAALVVTFGIAFVCKRNFGGGLKYHMLSKPSYNDFGDSKNDLGRGADAGFMMKSNHASRMSID